ncbi:MAG: metallophosphatase family protein [Acidobacteriota bacterium]|nr:metallophosphatase family protein [Acidobacteriota bacterium]
MRFLVISDIHGNWDALDTVLAAAATEAVDHVVVLGDLVGYGASPNEVVSTVADLAPRRHMIRGNHDKVVAGIDDGEGFNSVALEAAQWTVERLTEDHLEYVRRLAQGPTEIAPGFVICHGSPFDEDQYVLALDEAEEIFRFHTAQMTFFGHTHVPMLFAADSERVSGTALEGDALMIEVDPDKQYLINPGSVGQPRDRDPRAAYLIYDTEDGRIIWRRQEYPVERAQRRILDAGLPEVLAYRLAAGL